MLDLLQFVLCSDQNARALDGEDIPPAPRLIASREKLTDRETGLLCSLTLRCQILDGPEAQHMDGRHCLQIVDETSRRSVSAGEEGTETHVSALPGRGVAEVVVGQWMWTPSDHSDHRVSAGSSGQAFVGARFGDRGYYDALHDPHVRRFPLSRTADAILCE